MFLLPYIGLHHVALACETEEELNRDTNDLSAAEVENYRGKAR